MMKTIIASLLAIFVLGGCGFEDDAVTIRDVIIEVCEREGGQLVMGGTVGIFGADGITVACLYPPGKFPKYTQKK